MCGFVGFLDFKRSMTDAELAALAARMALQIESRGPDDAGQWVDEACGIALGHRRLSIIDLSPMGHQPMVSASGHHVIAFNGEVYNFSDVRGELEAMGVTFRSHSDTEVLLEACERWGVKKAISKFIGMFAFALWNRKDKTLTLARDRLGIKPLYWGRIGDVVFFGSQPKSFTPHPAWKGEVDRNALSSYMRHNYIPAPLSIYRNISKLEPGRIISINACGQLTHETYWDLREIARDGTRNRFDGSAADAVEGLDALLKDAVGKRMVSDVPLGAFLSGGIDSSTVAALMQAQSTSKVKTFSIGFSAEGYDEAPHAKAVAEHLGTDHTELYVEPSHVLDIIPQLPSWYDEPFADSSQLPTYLLSEMTRRDVTIALSGDGGDELFSGYDRYALGSKTYRAVGWIPHSLRKVAASGVAGVSIPAWDSMFSVVPKKVRPPFGGDEMHKLASVLRISDESGIYRRLLTQWEDPDELVKGGYEAHGILWDQNVKLDIAQYCERMQYLDTVTYLPDDILVKVDRASMAASLEARVPLIDHRVVEMSWRLPQNMKVRGGEGKWILRKVLEKYVPKKLTDRAKMGFGVPIEQFLRKELRDWAEALLDEKRLEEEGYFHPSLIRRRWSDHLAGRGNFAYPLWTVLMFQSWLEMNKKQLG